jgi:hypothetical protein
MDEADMHKCPLLSQSNASCLVEAELKFSQSQREIVGPKAQMCLHHFSFIWLEIGCLQNRNSQAHFVLNLNGKQWVQLQKSKTKKKRLALFLNAVLTKQRWIKNPNQQGFRFSVPEYCLNGKNLSECENQ